MSNTFSSKHLQKRTRLDIDGELARAVHFHADFANEVKDYDILERFKHVFKIQR